VKAHVAAPDDISGVADTLVEAFYSDPVWSWAFADPEHRKAQYGVWFRILLGGAIGHQWVWTTPAHEAVSVWVPPGCSELSPADETRLEDAFEDLLGDRAALLHEVFARFEASRPRERDHFYLSLLGTHSDHRGRGIGMEVLAANLAIIDALRMPSYLESTNPGNLRRYQSVGFEVCGEFELPDDGPTVTTMWREPLA
jgi:ribosomal protein S18 acetylase RimI-like enzyme